MLASHTDVISCFSYLAHRGLKTLHVRMEAAARYGKLLYLFIMHFYPKLRILSYSLSNMISNANAIALFLEGHQGVTKCVYPGLKSHPQHDIATRQQNGYGAMITFYCVGGREQSAIVLKNVSCYYT